MIALFGSDQPSNSGEARIFLKCLLIDFAVNLIFKARDNRRQSYLVFILLLLADNQFFKYRNLTVIPSQIRVNEDEAYQDALPHGGTAPEAVRIGSAAGDV